ncbi:uncharacterized protein LOC135398735 isoform X2 [Ornithodoros turicata]
MCIQEHAFRVVFVILASKPWWTAGTALQRSDVYYDEEAYYVEEDSESPANFSGDLIYVSYDNQPAAKRRMRSDVSKQEADPGQQAVKEFKRLRLLKSRSNKHSHITGCNHTDIMRTTEFCGRNLENAKEAIKYIDPNSIPRSHNRGLQVVCRLVNEYKFCMNEILADCRNITHYVDRQVSLNIRAEGFEYCVSAAICPSTSILLIHLASLLSPLLLAIFSE